MKHPIKIVSLNIQHGWNSDPPVPLLVRRRSIFANLNKIAELLERHKPDVVLLQEVDRISPLTKKIDQLRYIASRVGYLHNAYGASSEVKLGKRVVYAAGCGIMSRFPITASENVKFDANFPTPRKGFVMATLAISPTKSLTAVSAHLPPLNLINPRSRHAQLECMAKALHGKGPVVIGGDLNTCYSGFGHKNIHALASRLNVRAHPAVIEEQLATYPARDPRRKIDWVFASPEIRMTDYGIIPDRVSDHLAIGTTLTL